MCCFGAPGGGADTGMGDSARADGRADRGAKPTADTGMGDSAPGTPRKLVASGISD